MIFVNLSHPIKSKSISSAQYLCRCSDIPDGRSHGFDPMGKGKDTMFIVRKGVNFYAYQNDCPHYDYARMAWKKNEFLNGDHTMITCSAHGALFEISTGKCTIGPCIGKNLTPIELVIKDEKIWFIPHALTEEVQKHN